MGLRDSISAQRQQTGIISWQFDGVEGRMNDVDRSRIAGRTGQDVPGSAEPRWWISTFIMEAIIWFPSPLAP